MPRQAEDDSETEGEDSDGDEDRELLQRAMSIAWVPPSKDLANFAFVRQHYHHEVRRFPEGGVSLSNCRPRDSKGVWCDCNLMQLLQVVKR